MAKIIEPDDKEKPLRKIPLTSKKEIQEQYNKSIEEFENALDIETPKGIFEYLQAPGIIVVSVTLAYILGRFRFSFLFLIPLIYTIVYKFKVRMLKFKTSLQAQVYSQVRKEKVKGNFESVEWINHTISHFWTVAEPMISEEVFRTVNTFLFENCPNFLKSLRLTEFTLGSVSPKVTGVLFFDNLEDDIIQLDVEIVFVPLEISKELFYFVRKNKKQQFNSNITLVAKIGTKGTDLGISLPISVKNLAFKGLGRIIITITNNQFFMKEVEFCFLEEPYINFTLKPLKALDVMDLPGLSSWIKGVISSNLKNKLINPNSIKINLEKMVTDKKVDLGVLCLQMLEYESRYNEELRAEVDIDGKKYFTTSKNEGSFFNFNEYFYFIIRNVDDFVSVGLQSEAKGSLLLKRILIGDTIESMRIIDKHGIRAALKCVGHFYPVMPPEGKKHLTNSAIITLRVIEVDDLQAKNVSSSKLYTSFCTIAVSPDKLIVKKDDSNKLIKSTISATTNIFGGIFDALTGGKSAEKLLPMSKTTFFFHRSKTIVDSNSPKYNETCSFFSRDLKNDTLKICISDAGGEDANILGNLEVPLFDVYNGLKQWYRLNDAQKGRIELEFNINYIDLAERNSVKDFNDYKIILNVDLKECNTIFGYGSYNLLFKTKSTMIKAETFCVGVSELKRNILIPLEEKDSVELFLFKETPKEEHFIGSGYLLKEDESLESNESLILGKHPLLTSENIGDGFVKNVPLKKMADGSDTANVLLLIKKEPLTLYKGISDNVNQAKVIQVKFSDFNIQEPCRIEFKTNDELIYASKITNKSDVFTFISGKNEIMAVFKSDDIGKDHVIGSCLVPKRQLEEEVTINDKDKVKMKVKTLLSNFLTFSSLKKGSLKMTILEIKQLTFLQDVICKVFINDSQLHRTKVVKKCMNPKFNESITTYLDKRYDTLKIVIQNWMQFEPSKVIGVVETPLYFLEEGKFTHSLKLKEGNNLLETYVVCEFEFSQGDLYGLKKKKNVLGMLPF